SPLTRTSATTTPRAPGATTRPRRSHEGPAAAPSLPPAAGRLDHRQPGRLCPLPHPGHLGEGPDRQLLGRRAGVLRPGAAHVGGPAAGAARGPGAPPVADGVREP